LAFYFYILTTKHGQNHIKSELYLNIQFVPRSKLYPSRLQKPIG